MCRLRLWHGHVVLLVNTARATWSGDQSVLPGDFLHNTLAVSCVCHLAGMAAAPPTLTMQPLASGLVPHGTVA